LSASDAALAEANDKTLLIDLRAGSEDGDGGQAHEHLTTALTMYREVDGRFWLEQAEAEMEGLR
jgi:hypothetical protein